ncbi:MAG: dihydrodipicolinate synthase family protein [Bacteroidota bacterium]
MKTPKGVVNAILTPFDDAGKIDQAMLEKLTQFLVDGGLHGLFVNGSTGEGLVLSEDEKYENLSIIRSVAGNKIDLYGCCIRPSTHQVIADMERIAELNPEYVVAVPPLYYPADQEMITKHFVEIAAAAPAPLVLYNIPQVVNKTVLLETLAKLSVHPNIIGVKDSSGDFQAFVQGASMHASGEFCWMQGDDLLHSSSLQAGAEALVTGLGNVSIAANVGVYEAFMKGDEQAMWSHQKTLNAAYRLVTVLPGKGVPVIKAASALLGRSTFRMKDDWLNLTSNEVKIVEGVMKELGLIA